MAATILCGAVGLVMGQRIFSNRIGVLFSGHNTLPNSKVPQSNPVPLLQLLPPPIYCSPGWRHPHGEYVILAHAILGRKKDPFYRNIRNPIPPLPKKKGSLTLIQLWWSGRALFWDKGSAGLARSLLHKHPTCWPGSYPGS